MSNSNQLVTERNALWAKMEAIVKGEDGSLSDPDHLARYESLAVEFEAADKACTIAAQHETTRAAIGAAAAATIETGTTTGATARTDEERYAEAFDTYMRHGSLAINDEHRSILRSDPELQQRAQSVNSGVSGGYLVPPTFWNRMVETKKAFGGMLAVANVIDTETGNALPWPGNDDTGNVASIVGENVAVGNATDLAYTLKTLGAYTYTTGVFLVPMTLAQDSVFDVEGHIVKKGSIRLARRQNTDFTNGDAANKPQGMIPNLTVGKTTVSATAVTWQELLDTVHSVDPAYRDAASWMLHDLIVKEIRKLVDGNGRPLYAPGISVGDPGSFLGYNFTVNQDMDSTLTTGKTIAAFGDFSQAYVIRRVRGAQLLTLRERYAEILQTGYILFDRMDGGVDDTSAAKVLKTA